MWIPCEKNFMDFQSYYYDNYENGWIYPNYPQDQESFDEKQCIFGEPQTPEQTDRCYKNLNMLKEKFKFESIPQVIILDRTQEVVKLNASDDLLKLDPFACRQIWIEALQARIANENRRKAERYNLEGR